MSIITKKIIERNKISISESIYRNFVNILSKNVSNNF